MRAMWCKLCGESYVVQSMWCKLRGVINVAQALWAPTMPSRRRERMLRRLMGRMMRGMTRMRREGEEE